MLFNALLFFGCALAQTTTTLITNAPAITSTSIFIGGFTPLASNLSGYAISYSGREFCGGDALYQLNCTATELCGPLRPATQVREQALTQQMRYSISTNGTYISSNAFCNLTNTATATCTGQVYSAQDDQDSGVTRLIRVFTTEFPASYAQVPITAMASNTVTTCPSTAAAAATARPYRVLVAVLAAAAMA